MRFLFLCKNIFLVQRSKSNCPPAAVMPVRVKNSTTGAGSDSGKQPVCVQAPLGLQIHTDEQEVCVGKFMAVRRKLHLEVETNVDERPNWDAEWRSSVMRIYGRQNNAKPCRTGLPVLRFRHGGLVTMDGVFCEMQRGMRCNRLSVYKPNFCL